MEWAHFFFLIIMLLMFHSCVDAQAGTIINPPLGFTLKENLKATMSVMLVGFLFTFFFMCFFSLYLRHCTYGYNTNSNPITAATDLCLRGLNRELIDKCPVLVYSAVKNLKIGKNTLECAVCLSEFDDLDKIRLLPKCHHVFHPDCIDNWLLSHMSCPVCRTKLTDDVPDINIVPNDLQDTTTITELTDQQQRMEEDEDGQSSRTTVTAEVDTVINIPPRETRMLEKFPRSHSTGHSLTEIEENFKVVDRYSLRLPEHVRKHLLASNAEIPRLETSEVVLPPAWSSKRTCYRSSNNLERWSSYMTPPPRWGLLHDETTCWTPLRMPFNKVQGTQKPSPVSPV